MDPIQTISGRSAREVAASVEAAVADGRLPAEQRLPTIRDLADHLELAPGTVAMAYRTLRDRGVVLTEGRRGTFVRGRSVLRPRQAIGMAVPPGVVDLAHGNPDPDLLPDLGPHLVDAAGAAGLYGEDPDPWQHPGLVARLRERVTEAGVPTEHLAVVSGALDGVERTLAAHLAPGDVVAVEDPGWPNLLDLVAAMGLRAVPLAVDDDGPMLDALASVVDEVDAVVVTSRSHNPTGAAVTPARRDQLAGLLSGRDVLVVEDDHGGEASGVVLASLADTTRRWVLVQSLSKSWGPDLRVAALFGDARTVALVAGRFRLGPGWVSRVLQSAAASLLVDPDARATVDQAAATLRERRERLLDALADRGITGHGRSGLNAWIAVPDEGAVVAGLQARGWAVAPGARYRQHAGPGIRVTAAAVTDPAMAMAFAADLATVVASPARAVV
ncbi:aminotransferase class I/II-fold pyridoxal phosphate-dependent enzyme [Salsipaludibacter albus]|uniref:aminotransferase class I/II-fold pyridoxal phosphate-dependent enzyme n=1 Tax=Salsipaludibacter albus TaxID=2849650 RepID=UPI001EE46DF3|nr:aminotransferase class I/II-fold pyridoxal phosphate-dependent enzyme [Salsipaludibacter albus]MBY5162624.1 aminotransferase class I/II-fold pyridoxal phosphate-dependent enzyme [Salsipaludibacter albus]